MGNYDFVVILVLLAAATVIGCIRHSKIICSREAAKVARQRAYMNFIRFDKKRTLSCVYKRYAIIYLMLVLYYSVVYLYVRI